MKKTLLTLSMLILMFAAFAQNQVSELAKGMVFHAPLNEWYPSKDLVTGILGTATATYPIAGRNGDGSNRYYSFNGTSDYAYIASSDALKPTSAITIIVKIYRNSSTNQQVVINKGADDYDIYYAPNSTYPRIYIEGLTGGAYITSTVSSPDNQWNTIVATYDSSGGTNNLNIYVNGVLGAAATRTGNITASNGNLYLGAYSASQYKMDGSISLVRIFNYSLSAQQIANYSKPEYPIEYSDRDGAGNLCVLDLNSSGLARASDGSYNTGYWTDRTNSITATVSGATPIIPPASNLTGTWFDANSSKIQWTGMDGLTGNITLFGKIFVNSFGEGNAGRIFDNSKIVLYTNSSGYLTFSRDGSTTVNSAAASQAINTYYNFAVTSTSAGVANIYINGVLSGTANQSAGTPASGTTWNIGNNAAGSATFGGHIREVGIINRVLEPDVIKLLNETY